MTAIPVPQPDPYATTIPSRDPAFKTHRNLGQAKNAVLYMDRRNGHFFNQDMIIHRLEEGFYRPWIEIDHGTSRNDYPELAEKSEPRVQLERRYDELVRSAKAHDEYARKAWEKVDKMRRTLWPDLSEKDEEGWGRADAEVYLSESFGIGSPVIRVDYFPVLTRGIAVLRGGDRERVPFYGVTGSGPYEMRLGFSPDDRYFLEGVYEKGTPVRIHRF